MQGASFERRFRGGADLVDRAFDSRGSSCVHGGDVRRESARADWKLCGVAREIAQRVFRAWADAACAGSCTSIVLVPGRLERPLQWRLGVGADRGWRCSAAGGSFRSLCSDVPRQMDKQASGSKRLCGHDGSGVVSGPNERDKSQQLVARRCQRARGGVVFGDRDEHCGLREPINAGLGVLALRVLPY